MTYNDAVVLRNQNQNVLGKPFQNSVVKHIFIANPERIGDVVEWLFKYDQDNETVLKNLGIINSTDLEVYILPELDYGVIGFCKIQEYLKGIH